MYSTHTVRAKKTCPKSRVLLVSSKYTLRARKLLLKIMAVLAKVSKPREQLPSVLVDPCLYYCCTTHQALAALRSFFVCVQRAVQEPFDRCAWAYAMLYVSEFTYNLWTAATLLYSTLCTSSDGFLWHTYMYVRTHVRMRMYMYAMTSLS